VPHLSRP